MEFVIVDGGGPLFGLFDGSLTPFSCTMPFQIQRPSQQVGDKCANDYSKCYPYYSM
jgi:hypothetical protein